MGSTSGVPGMISRDRVEQGPWLSSSDSLMCLQDSMELDQLPYREPAYSTEQFSPGPPMAEEPADSPGSCQLLYLQGFKQVLLCTTPQSDQVDHLAHYYPISNHEPGVESCICRDLLQAIDPCSELPYHGAVMVTDVLVPL